MSGFTIVNTDSGPAARVQTDPNCFWTNVIAFDGIHLYTNWRATALHYKYLYSGIIVVTEIEYKFLATTQYKILKTYVAGFML